MLFATILFVTIGFIMFILAYFLYFKEAYWLISGINLRPRQTVRERYDLPGLTRHMGRMCALIGLILLVSGIGAFLDRDMVVIVPLGFIFIVVPVFLFGSERYMYEGRRTQRILNLVITAFLAVTVFFTAVMMVSGARAPKIYIEDETVVIESAYGTKIPLDSIQEVAMIELEGKQLSKISGFNLGDRLRGRFQVEGLGNAQVFQQGKPCNSVLIRTEKRMYLINLGTEAENEKLRKEIEEGMEENNAFHR